MTSDTAGQLGPVAEALMVLGHEQPSSWRAIERFTELLDGGERTAEAVPVLVVSREGYSGARQYMALVDVGRGSFLVAWQPDLDLPWPLRGAQRWNLDEVGRVDGVTVSVVDVLSVVDLVWNVHLTDRLVERALLSGQAQRRGLRVSAAERAEHEKRFRHDAGLTSDEALDAWMSTRGLTRPVLEQHLWGLALREKLAGHLYREPDRREEPEGSFDLVTVARIVTTRRELAAELCRCPREEFLELIADAAERQELEMSIENRRRHQLSEAEAARFGRRSTGWQPGYVTDEGPPARIERVLRVRQVHPMAVPEAERRSLALRRWLAERKAEAHVEWNWGDPGL